jgi:hypothetical protein
VAAGIPLGSECRLEFIEVCPPTRLLFAMQADFIPSVDPYVVNSAISIESTLSGIKLTVTFDPMYDEDCHASQVSKLAQVLRDACEGIRP